MSTTLGIACTEKEQLIASVIAGLNVALEQARALADEKSAFKLLQALKSSREDHRRQVLKALCKLIPFCLALLASTTANA